MRILFPILFSLLLAGCARPERPAVVIAIRGAVSAAAAQVRRCYRDPVVPSVGKRIVTHLRVRYSPDGTLLGLPRVLRQEGVTPENAAYAERMAEAASLAVMRCSPLALSRRLHRGGWDDFELIFSHAALA
jgi:hypothetical protein